MAPVRGDVRSTRRWKDARRRALRGATTCEICHRPLDFDAEPRSRWAPSVDHVLPLSRGGDPFAQSNLRPVHVGCNSSRGNALRARAVVPMDADWF